MAYFFPPIWALVIYDPVVIQMHNPHVAGSVPETAIITHTIVCGPGVPHVLQSPLQRNYTTVRSIFNIKRVNIHHRRGGFP